MIEHDPSDPVLRLGDWLTAGRRRAHRLPPARRRSDPGVDLTGYDALISMGGEMGARDDDIAPWLPATRRLLATAVRTATPTLGVCLGGQLLAAATGGTVRKGPDGPEIGAYLTAKRDAAMSDPLFADLPMTPDVMQYHYDVVSIPAAGRRAVAVLDGLSEPGLAAGTGRLGTAVPPGNHRRERPGLGARRGPAADRPARAGARRRRGDHGRGVARVRVPVRGLRPGCRPGRAADRPGGCSRWWRSTNDQTRGPHPGPVRAAQHRPGPHRPGGRRAVRRRPARPRAARTSSRRSPGRAARNSPSTG